MQILQVHKEGGGATRFKQHLAGRERGVVHCSFVPPDVRDYFRRELDRTAAKKKDRQREPLRREEIAAKGNEPINVPSDEDEELQRALHMSREEEAYARRVREQGGQYEHGGGSEAQGSGGGGLLGKLKRSMSSKGRKEATVQPRIDTGPWTTKGKAAKQAIGKAWAKFFHAEAIPRKKADSPYFTVVVKETQRWGEGIPSPTGRDIDGHYLDANEEDIRKQFAKFKLDWPTHGLTIMCDSWTGPTGMSLINFMVYCNGIMYFRRSVDATGHSQDADFIFGEIRKVVEELGEEHIVQIITDNGVNYKKACRLLARRYNIIWQLCVAHTINLMLKSVGGFPEHKAMIEGVRRISRWLYNHNKLHAMMKAAIGGELVRWNATRFGTNYMFLESMLRRKEKFMAWMSSSSFLESHFSSTDEGRYAHGCLSSLPWWDNMKYVVEAVEPLYAFLRFADQDKVPNLSEVLLRFTLLRSEYESKYHDDPRELERYMNIINPRMHDITTKTYVNAASTLHPRTHYKYGTTPNVLNELRHTFEFMTDTNTCVVALQEAEIYRRKQGAFSIEVAQEMALKQNTSPSI